MKNIVVYARWLKWFSLFLVGPLVLVDFLYTWCRDKVCIGHHEWSSGVICCEGNQFNGNNWDEALFNLPFWQRVAGFAVDGISYILLFWGLCLLIKLLARYQNGNIFSLQSFELIRKISRVAFGWALYAPIKSMILSLIVTLHKGPGNRMISLTVSSHDIYHIFIVGLLLVVASLMYEGYKLKCDQDLTV